MRKHISKTLSLAALLISVALLPVTPFAHQGATGVVKQRMDAMSEMGDAMGVMADMVKGKRPFDPEQVRASAAQLVQHADKLVELFPDSEESRSGAKTEALPVIWDDWDRFVSLFDALESTLGEFRAISAADLDEQTLRPEFRKIAKACSGCHEDFRKPED